MNSRLAGLFILVQPLWKPAPQITPKTVELIEEKKLTKIIITHNMKDAVEFSDRIIMLEEGKVIEWQEVPSLWDAVRYKVDEAPGKGRLYKRSGGSI